MIPYACRCSYIPPHVLDNLAGAGIEEARISVQQSTMTRENRSRAAVDMTRLAAAAPGAAAAGPAAARKVYTSEQTTQQRKVLARGEGDAVAADGVVNEVYDSADKVRQYFRDKLGRNSIDNQGMDLILNVHYGVNYMNAFWDGDEMTFGDGDGNIFINFAKSLDVTAHELTHGVTQFTAGLQYYSQSGALNEHFSDVFGTVITQFALGQDADSADWLIGDEIMGPQLQGEALRSMKEPGTAFDNQLMGKDPQPAHMKDYYTGPADNRGVHINSGIPNKAFYLTARDIGTEKAALIWYDGLQRLWATATFKDAVQVITEAARRLTNGAKVPKGSPQAVRAAFKAVGLPQ